MVNVLFVCMGNICRSPTAQGVFEQLVLSHGLSEKIRIDSAGTHAYHVGEPPDRRAGEAALRRGIDLSTQQARRVTPNDFIIFDYILAMDEDNYQELAGICSADELPKLHLFMRFSSEKHTAEVPDPYYGGASGFERVLDLIESAAEGLLAEIRQQHGV